MGNYITETTEPVGELEVVRENDDFWIVVQDINGKEWVIPKVMLPR